MCKPLFMLMYSKVMPPEITPSHKDPLAGGGSMGQGSPQPVWGILNLSHSSAWGLHPSPWGNNFRAGWGNFEGKPGSKGHADKPQNLKDHKWGSKAVIGKAQRQLEVESFLPPASTTAPGLQSHQPRRAGAPSCGLGAQAAPLSCLSRWHQRGVWLVALTVRIWPCAWGMHPFHWLPCWQHRAVCVVPLGKVQTPGDSKVGTVQPSP